MKKLYYIFILTFIGSNFISGQDQICVGTPGEIKWQYWNDLFIDQIGELTAQEFFPYQETFSKSIFKTESPLNYAEQMGARMAGFISVPVSDSVTFNLTGNDKARFYLSSGESPANKELVAFINDWTSPGEFNKYAEQTSNQVYLQSGQYYYFEILYVDYTGYDHAALYWKTNNVDPDNWNIITADYIYGEACTPDICPLRKTPCDDGLSYTINDQEDGHCNCIGQIISQDVCVGEKEVVINYRYEDIPGSQLTDLLNHPNYPSIPSYSRQLNYYGVPGTYGVDSVGGRVQAYLTVPESGDYSFNLTGDNQTVFFLSSDHQIENKQTTQAVVSSYTGVIEHDKYIFQTTGSRYLEKGKFYYTEVISKENTGNEHFSVFWKTPYSDTDDWKRIPSFYLYNYECTTACISAGTLCDDGNAFTNNDQYNEECECVGSPCVAPNCDEPIANYQFYNPCDQTDQLSNDPLSQWLSCDPSPSPNEKLGNSHWIMYDFGDAFKVYESHIWNYNEKGSIDKGFEYVRISYSLDEENWIEFGTYAWSLATGDNQYSGFEGPYFNGIEMKYILIQSLDMGSDCKGISKITFNACPIEGTPCNDKNDLTISDKYDDDCNCRGVLIDENQCDISELILGDSILVSNNYSAINNVESISQIDTNAVASFVGGQEVSLLSGFETPIGTEFLAVIDPCAEEKNVLLNKQSLDPNFPKAKMTQKESLQLDAFKLIELNDSDDLLVQFRVDKSGPIFIDIKNEDGILFTRFIEYQIYNPGVYFKRLRTKKLKAGNYSLSYQSNYNLYQERLFVN